jgi:dihydrofolate reductase
VDGFLARKDGAVDFLPADGGESHGFDEFYASVDAVVIGRKTFEWVVNYGEWVYGKKRVVGLSSRPLDLSGVRGRARVGHAYIDGGETIQRFLRARLIQRLVITRVPVLIGEGIPLFGVLPQDVRLRHVGTESYGRGW